MITAIDTETFLIFPGYLAPEMVCASFADDSGDGVLHAKDSVLFEFLRSRLEGRTVWANAPFDLAVIAEKFPSLLPVIFRALDEGRVHDIQTREKLLDLARGTFRFEEDEDGNVKKKGYSLGEIAFRRLGVRLDKDTWRMRYHELWDTPVSEWPEGARVYAADDAKSTLGCFLAQEKLSKYLGNEAAQVRAHFALHLMSCRGFMTNADKVAELEIRVRADIKKIRAGLIESGLVREDGTRDTKAAIARMVEKMGADCVLTTKGLELVREGKSRAEVIASAPLSGKHVSVSMDSTILSGDPVLIDYSTYTRLRNLLTGSVKHLRSGAILPIQPRFHPLMETGRTSSSGFNIQNVRRAPGVRECFIPRTFMLLIACDYSSAELHTLAQVCFDLFGESKLGEALNSGVDVHLWFGSLIMGIEYEDAVRLKKSKGLELADDRKELADMRQLAKAANFGFPGGCSARRFVGIAYGWGVVITLKQAAKLRALWFETWPEMRRYFDYISASEVGDGFYWVNQVRVERLRLRCTYTSACNSYFQGLCADGAKEALYQVTKAQFDPSSPLFGFRALAFIHDEIIGEAPEGRAHECALELQRIMESVFNRYTPDCPTTAEPTVMSNWSKKAKPTKDANGRLVAWKEAA